MITLTEEQIEILDNWVDESNDYYDKLEEKVAKEKWDSSDDILNYDSGRLQVNGNNFPI